MTREGFRRKLAAIPSADVEGYSRLMGDDGEATVRTLTACREVVTALVRQHNGKALDAPGDNLPAEFVSVVDPAQGAVAVQKEIKARNEQLPAALPLSCQHVVNTIRMPPIHSICKLCRPW